MKSYKRLLSLLLVCFVCFGLFSVNAFAFEESENLVDSDLSNWDKLSVHDIWGVENSKIYPIEFVYSSYYNAYVGYFEPSVSGSFNMDMYGGICELTNLVVGQRYKFSIDMSCAPASFTDYFDIFVGVCYFKDGVLYPYDNIDIFKCSINSSSYINNSFEFEYSYNGYQPYLFIIQQCNTTFDGSSYRLLINNVSLSRQVSETEKKLDGILGWLEDIKNSIIGLPETIKTNFQTFFSNLENKINDFKNIVTEKFTTLSTEFSSYITNLGNNIKGFFDDFWENISKWFEKFKPRIDVKQNIENIEIQHNNYVWFEYTVPEGCVFTLDYFGKSSSSDYIRIGDYYGFASNTAKHYLYSGDSIELTSGKYYFHWVSSSSSGFNANNFLNSFDIYCDSGWFSYFSYNLKDNLNSINEDIKLKIDLKIEEIKQNLHDLFIPSEGYFDDLSNRFDLLIEQRFGALVTITDYLVDFFSSFNADVTKEFFDVPIININLMGYNFPIGGWQVRFVPQFNGVEILTNACKFISSVLATFAFFDGLKNKYHEVFGGGE